MICVIEIDRQKAPLYTDLSQERYIIDYDVEKVSLDYLPLFFCLYRINKKILLLSTPF